MSAFAYTALPLLIIGYCTAQQQQPPPRKPNRLIHSTSPYLQQHAYNPVDWYPWGEEAFQRARKENKPIFLSVGYSTCYWCHVMAEESFEDTTVAHLLNTQFIPVKVDREELPDVDAYYMRALMLITGGHGGWPMNMFLTPDLEPFWGITYMPTKRFIALLHQIAHLWSTRHHELINSAREIAQATQRSLNESLPDTLLLVPQWVATALIGKLENRFDWKWGGFSTPKFPPHHTLRLLLVAHQQLQHPTALPMAEKTLTQMALGGIRDHIGGGFHRYATDRQWLIPHFEKMLYDQALLLYSYATAYSLTHQPLYAQVASEIVSFLERELLSPAGGFYSALDASSGTPPAEGAYYLWTPQQVKKALGEVQGTQFCQLYDITPEGNFHNPHTGTRASIPNLIKTGPIEEKTHPWVPTAREKLLHWREKHHPYPSRDHKLIASWNALTAIALFAASKALNNTHYQSLALNTCEFLWTHLWKDSTLYHSIASGQLSHHGYLDDWAATQLAFTFAYQHSRDPRWLEQATIIATHLWERFWNGNALSYRPYHSPVSIPTATLSLVYDGAEPSPTALALWAYAHLWHITRQTLWLQHAREILASVAGTIRTHPDATPSLVALLLHYPELAPYMLPPAILEIYPKKKNNDTLEVLIRLADQWHLTLTATDTQALTVEGASLQQLQAPTKTIHIGKDRFVVTDSPEVSLTLKLHPSPKASNKSVKLHLQVCSTSECLPPKTVEIAPPE